MLRHLPHTRIETIPPAGEAPDLRKAADQRGDSLGRRDLDRPSEIVREAVDRRRRIRLPAAAAAAAEEKAQQKQRRDTFFHGILPCSILIYDILSPEDSIVNTLNHPCLL